MAKPSNAGPVDVEFIEEGAGTPTTFPWQRSLGLRDFYPGIASWLRNDSVST